MKIIGYLRVSTDQQVESGLGLGAQKGACEDYAKRKDSNVSEVFSDEGFSGTLPIGKRPGLQSAISALKKGDILLVAKRDRLGRDKRVVSDIEDAVFKKGARIISCAGEGTENDEPSSFFMRDMIDGAAAYERRMIGARTKAALKVKRDKGERCGYIPFGWQLAEDGLHIERSKIEESRLKEIRKFRAKGLSYCLTAIAMNKKGLLNRGNKKWNHTSVHRIMQNQKEKA